MDEGGKIGPGDLRMSGSLRSMRTNTNRDIGFYGSGMKGMPRPRNLRSSYMRRHTKTIGLLLVFAAAIILVSSVALMPVSKEKAAPEPRAPANTTGKPGPPYVVSGQTFDSFGAVMGSSTVTITDMNTGNFSTQVSDPDWGYYEFDLNVVEPNWTAGDLINVTAVNGIWVGWNESYAGIGPNIANIWMDVTIQYEIPEFPMVIVPVIGMMALVVAVSLRRRGEAQ